MSFALRSRFDDLRSECNGAYEMKPRVGLLQAFETQLIMMKFTPKSIGQFRCRLTCAVNSDYHADEYSSGDGISSNELGITLHGIGTVPHLVVCTDAHESLTASTTSTTAMAISSPHKVCLEIVLHKRIRSVRLCSIGSRVCGRRFVN